MQPKKDNQKGMVLGAAVCLALILTSTALGVYTGPEDATASLPPSAPETLSWPLALGDSVTLSAKFETRVHPITQKEISHDGIDIPQPAGTPVLAAADGIVLEAGFNITDGNYILLQHADLTTQYAHLQEISVEPGETVSTGEEIGTVGKTGMATGEHLHFGVLQDGVPIDPLEYLDSAAAAQLPSA